MRVVRGTLLVGSAIVVVGAAVAGMAGGARTPGPRHHARQAAAQGVSLPVQWRPLVTSALTLLEQRTGAPVSLNQLSGPTTSPITGAPAGEQISTLGGLVSGAGAGWTMQATTADPTTGGTVIFRDCPTTPGPGTCTGYTVSIGNPPAAQSATIVPSSNGVTVLPMTITGG